VSQKNSEVVRDDVRQNGVQHNVVVRRGRNVSEAIADRQLGPACEEDAQRHGHGFVGAREQLEQ
jgi:hypothetical protein